MSNRIINAAHDSYNTMILKGEFDNKVITRGLLIYNNKCQHLLFKVYGYNVSAGGEGCCLPGYPRPLQEEFRPVNENTKPLPGRLDVVYYSYHYSKLFIIKVSKGNYYQG